MASTSKDVVDPANNVMEFVQSVGKGPLKQVAYQVLQWVQGLTGAEEKPPGNASTQETSPKDFMKFFKDGAVLGNIANVLKPESVAQEKQGKDAPKEDQLSQIKSFLNFAEKDAGVEEAKQVNAEQVAAGNTSQFGGLLGTLIGLGKSAMEKFQKSGIDTQQLIAIVQGFVASGFFQKLIARFFKKGGAQQVSSQQTKAVANDVAAVAEKADVADKHAAPLNDAEIQDMAKQVTAE